MSDLDVERTAPQNKLSINGEAPVELTPEWKSWLIKYNAIACGLHFVQAVIMLGGALSVDNFKNFKLPLWLYYLTEEELPSGKSYLTLGKSDWGDVAIGPLVCIFFFLSALAHAFVLFYREEIYFKDLSKGINRSRWWEYAFSSSFMIVIIAQLFGMYDIASLFLVFTSNFATQFMGLLMERMNPPGTEELDWTPFLVGCITGFSPWIAVFFYFLGSGPSSSIPGFVYGVLAGYFIFFNTFPLNMILQYKKVGKWQDYLFGEQVYILLSLLSKSLLGWLVFGGVNQPNKYTS